LDVAMAALELADVIQAPNNNADESVASASLSVLQLKRLKSALKTLQQQAIDMLWRIDEKAIAIRWMLSHNQVCLSTLSHEIDMKHDNFYL
jgi:hypothetical protein